MQEILQHVLNRPVELQNSSSVSGGDINAAYCLQTREGKYFVKVNRADAFPGMFETEAKGLGLLRERSDFIVPKVHGVVERDEQAYIVMEFLEQTRSNIDIWGDFGRTLAAMHRQSSEHFGLDHDNYIGSLPQKNKQSLSWSEFYADHRILPLTRLAFDSDLLNLSDVEKIEKHLGKTDELYPIEKPALLHGDLWSGNAFFVKDGRPSIFDPAVYYGHRFMDLGMMQLFGGFPETVFAAYDEVYPLPNTWRESSKLAQLYPLLVHVVLFGGSYVNQVRGLVKGGN